MEEIAAVGVRIDTVDIERGAQELDRLASKGPVVEKSMGGIEQSSGRAGKTIATLGKSSGQGLSNLSRDADKAAASIERTGDAAQSASSQLASLGKSLLGALSVREFVQAADAVTTLQNQLKLATGSATSAASAYASLFDIAQRSRVGFVGIGKTFASIARSSESLKLNQEQLLKVTEAVANAVTISGSSAASSQAALIQLGQGLSSGVLRGEELNSILEQTPRLARAIADGLSVPIGALRKLGEEGKLTAEAVATALRSQSATLAREVEDSVTTVGQAFVQTKNAAIALSGEVSRATGSNSLLVTIIQAVADSLNDVSSAMRAFESNSGKFEFVGGAVGVVFETISVLGATAVDTIAGVGREFAAIAAQARAIASGDLAGVSEIRRALIEDNQRAEKELDAFIAKVMTARDLRKQAIADLAALDTRAEDARLARLAGNSVPALDFSKLIKGTKKAADEFAALRSAAKEWADSFEDLVKIQADAEASTNGLTKGQARLLEVLKSRGFKEASDSAKELVLQQAYAAIAAEKLKEETEALGKVSEDAAKSYKDWIDALERDAEQAIQQADKLKIEAEAAMLVVEGRRSLAQAIEEVTIKRLQEKQVAMMGDEAAVLAIEKEIKARRELIGLIGNKESRDAAAKAAKDAADEWRKTADKIEDAITDSLMRGFESGKGFAENLRNTVENMFKTMVLRPVISAIVQPVAQQLAGLTGAGGGTFGTASNGANLYNAAGAAAGLWGSSAAYGAAIGTANIAAGSQAAMLASQTAVFGAEGAAMTAAAAGNAATGSIMSTIGAAAPYLAAAYAIYMIAKSLDDSGTIHTGASSQYSAAAGLSTGMGVYGVGSEAGSYGIETESLTTSITQSIVGILDSTASTFGKQAGYAAAAGFADDTSNDGAWGSLSIKIGDRIVEGFGQDGNGRWPGQSFSDGQAGTQEYLAAVSADVRNALEQIGLPDWASGMLDRLGDAPGLDQLAATVAQINATQAALTSMGAAMPQLAGLTDAAVNSLLSSFGSIDQLASSAQSYYENFYSQAERSAETTRQISEALGDLGLTMPATREAFRSLVEAQDMTTEAGQKTYAALLKLSPAFASVVAETQALTDAVDETAAAIAKAAEEMAEAGRRALASLAEDQGSLLVELLNAQGNGAEASALERQQALARITEGLSETDKAAATAAYDYNEALRDQITALLAATDAQKQAEAEAKQAADASIAQAKARADAIAGEQSGLMTRLLQAQGDTASLRARERELLDESNRALYDRVIALQDQTAAEQDAQRIAQSVAAERYSLETRLLQAQGSTAELRLRELEALDPANRKYLEQLFALEDKTAAEQAATAAAQEAARAAEAAASAQQRAAEAAASAQQRAAEEAERAAERIRDAWQSVADSLYDEVSRIRGLIQQDSGASYASMAARFGITTAQARAGDQEAAKLLPSLSQTMLTLAEAQATSLAELQRIRAQTAASLESTGSILASQFGLTIPKLDTGTNFVPRDMLAVIHKGEAVVPAAYNPASGGSSNAEVVAELRGLREENKVQALRIVQLSAELNRVVKAWDANGMPSTRVEV